MQIKANGISINYTLTGDSAGPVVTLSHSLATNLDMWQPQLPVLEARFRVLRFDTRGHGGTEVPTGPYTLEQLAADAYSLLQQLGIDRTHFIGLSMGGMIAQALALRHPEVLQSLVLCDTSSRVPSEAHPVWDERIRIAETEGMEPHVEPTIGRWFTPGFLAQRPPVVDTIRQMIRSTDPKGYVGCSQAIRMLDYTDDLNRIKIPTLVIVGDSDPGTPVAASRTIHERINDSRLSILRSASHLSNIEQAGAFNEAVSGFLASRSR
jgi:3-oxoadipate enol-lactonase